MRSVEASYRVWHHTARAHEAFVADAERRERKGSVHTYGTRGGVPEPDEQEETLRIWRQDVKVRLEQSGGQRDGYYAVAVPPLWWMWDERIGARSNEDDPSVGNHVGQELEIMLDPTPVLSCLRFRLTGSSQVAGRTAFSARGTLRPVDDRFGGPMGLGALGGGGDYYELEVDQERGVLLAAAAFFKGEPFRALTALSIRFDEPLEPEVFSFEAPAGEKVESFRGGPRPRPVTLAEAQRQTPFTVLMPDTVPVTWQVQCRLIEPRRAQSMQIGLSYHSTDGHESIHITQTPAGVSDRPGIGNEEDWETVTQGGREIKTRPATWGQAQARFEDHGTYVNLMSDNLTRDQLVSIAAKMRPAPTASDI
jgi:hypothetical protein